MIENRNSHLRTGIYSIQNMATGELYVGSAAKGFSKRWVNHRCRLKRGEHHSRALQSGWNFYGPHSFLYTIIEDCVPEMCAAREQFWITFFNPEYNVLKLVGSRRGLRHSEETRLKMSISRRKWKHSEASKAKMSAARVGLTLSSDTVAKIKAARARQAPAFAGRFHTDATKAKISAAKLGRKLSAGHRSKISAAMFGKPHPHLWGRVARQLKTEAIT